MGWFDEQIRQRKRQDDADFSASFANAASSVLGEHYSMSTEEVMHPLLQIVKYFKQPLFPVPPEVKEAGAFEVYEYIFRNAELMARNVKVEPGWHKKATGVYLGKREDTGEIVSIFPRGFHSYYYVDEKTGKHVAITKKNEMLFSDSIMCVYRSLPTTKLTSKDLLKFAISALSKFDIALMLIMLILSTLVGLLIPKLSYFLFSTVVASKSITLLLSTIIFMACVSVSQLLFTATKTMSISKAGLKLNLTVEAAVMERVISLPTTFFKQYSSGEIVQRMDYLNSICSSMLEVVFSTVLTSFFSLAYFSQIAKYAPGLILPALLIIFANLAFSLIATLYQMQLTKKRMELSAKNNGIALDMISGIQKIKLTGSEKRMFSRWSNNFAKETRIMYNPPLFLKLNKGIALLLSLLGQFVVYWYAVKYSVGVAEYYAFQTAYGMVFGAVSTLVMAVVTMAELKPRFEMVKPILDTIPEKSDKDQLVTKLNGEIEMSHVTFRYEEGLPNVLDDFSLSIQPGEYVAIVGKTGCGKSTLVRLLHGFEKPQNGLVLYDGRDLSTLDKKQLRKRIGSVLQNDKLFFGDIYSNISIASTTLTLDEAWEAAELAGVADDIRKMPMGMHTVITEGSTCISGGQRQRIIIARAIAPKPSVLIFDEATSALDNITQKKISDSLDSLKCTRIVIAHRLSTIKHCDRILVMDEGKIVEEGTYDELIAKNGYFAELVERQRV